MEITERIFLISLKMIPERQVQNAKKISNIEAT